MKLALFEGGTCSNFFRFPLILLYGFFIPVQTLPLFLRPLSYILPLTYGADILKSAISQTGHLGVPVDFCDPPRLCSWIIRRKHSKCEAEVDLLTAAARLGIQHLNIARNMSDSSRRAGALASYFIARRTARMKPVDILRRL